MKRDPRKAGLIPLLLAFSCLYLFQAVAAGQSAAGQAETTPLGQEEQQKLLLFTFIPPASAPLTEADLLPLSLDPASPVYAGPSRAPLLFDGPAGISRNFRPRSGWAVLENSLFTASLLSFVGLNIVDYLTTKKIVKELGLEAVSPLFRPLVKNDYAFAAFKIGLTLMSCLSFQSIHDTDKPMAWVLSLLSNFLVSYAVAYNLEQLENSHTR
ncbi:MAG: hypothetical protein WCB96_10500 [Candidatus Aminicenantales bacterium]